MNQSRKKAVPIERLNLDEVANLEKIQSGRVLSPTKIGYYLALFLLIYLSLVTGFIIVDYLRHQPSLPTPTNLTPEMIKNYEALSKLALDRALSLFEKFVQTSFLPVLTAILGYIFGIRGMEKQDS